MFPSTHDITPKHLDLAIDFLKRNVLPWHPETKRAKAEKENSVLALRNILSMLFPSLPGVRFEHRPSFDNSRISKK